MVHFGSTAAASSAINAWHFDGIGGDEERRRTGGQGPTQKNCSPRIKGICQSMTFSHCVTQL